MTNRIDKNIQTIRSTIFPKTIEQITRVGLGGEGALRVRLKNWPFIGEVFFMHHS